MKANIQDRPIVIADDSMADRRLAITALKQINAPNPLHEVKDGEELMDYLLHRGEFANRPASPSPALILLDLNMPRKNGLEALKEIKSQPELRQIPVVMLTTSQTEWDIVKSYDLGVNSYVSKPVDFDQFLVAMQSMGDYWLDLVSIPPDPKKSV